MGVHCWLSPGQELSQESHLIRRMGRTNKDQARKSPILLSSWKNKNIFEKHKIMRMSLKKLRKLGDPETGLHRAVLINNTLDCMRNGGTKEDTGPVCKKESSFANYAASSYSSEEEHILNSIHLPNSITHISDEGFNQENSEAGNNIIDNRCDSVMERILGTIPTSTSLEVYSKHNKSTNSDIYCNKVQNQRSLKEKILSQRVLNISLIYDCSNSSS